MNTSSTIAAPLSRSRWARFTAVAGPGLVVMLADTNAGSIITAVQSGARWEYNLLLLQAILIPVLFVVQELTARLGIVMGQGHRRRIQQHFGPVWARILVGTLLLACVDALVSGLSGIAGVGALVGIPAWQSMAVMVVGLVTMAYTGSYLTMERIALAVRMFEFVFLLVAWKAQPEVHQLVSGAVSMPLHDTKYLYLIAANIGAATISWMVFYRQSAVVEKGLTIDDLPATRWDTAVGAVVTQLIMGAVLVAITATIGRTGNRQSFDTVQQIAQAITPFLGKRIGAFMFTLGMIGAALVATIVVTLTAAQALGEVMGFEHSLEHHPRETLWFYGVYTLALVLGGILVASGVDLVKLSADVQVTSALLLPIVLDFLYVLVRRVLPEPHSLKGGYAALVVTIIVLAAGFGLYSGMVGVLD